MEIRATPPCSIASRAFTLTIGAWITWAFRIETTGVDLETIGTA